jgi:uncharacterized protein (TIGR02246 family)
MAATRPEQVNELFEEAVNRGDVEEVVKLYEPNACLVGAPDQVANGLDAIREALTNFLASKPHLKMEPGKVLGAGGIALLSHGWRATGNGPEGPFEMSGTAVEVVREQADGTWLFVVDDPFAIG